MAKIYYMGKRINSPMQRAKAWTMMWLIRLVWILVITGIVVGIYELGAYTNPKTIITKAEVIKEVPIKASVLDRIAQCESGNRHYSKNGQVQINVNKNGTVDIGVMQINTVWFAKATELGLDITKEADNKAMAQWIYENRGTQDWYSSAKCWQR